MRRDEDGISLWSPLDRTPIIGVREKSGERFELKKKGARAIAGRRRENLRSVVWSVVSSGVRNEEQVCSGWGRSWIIHSFAKRRERPGV